MTHFRSQTVRKTVLGQRLTHATGFFTGGFYRNVLQSDYAHCDVVR